MSTQLKSVTVRIFILTVFIFYIMGTLESQSPVMAVPPIVENTHILPSDSYEFRLPTFEGENLTKKPVITGMALSTDGQTLYVGGDDQYVYSCNLKTKEAKRVFQKANDWVRSVAVQPKGDKVAVLSQTGQLTVWDSNTQKKVNESNDEIEGARGLVYSPNGKVIAVSSFHPQVHIYDAETLKKLVIWKAPGESSTAIVFSFDGRQLALGGRDGTVRIWTTNDGTISHDLVLTNSQASNKRRVRAIAFSPDNKYLAAGGDCDQIIVWDVQNGNIVAKLQTNGAKVYSLLFYDEHKLVSGDSCNRVCVWDLTTKKLISVGDAHTGTVSVLLKNPLTDSNNSSVLSGSFDTNVLKWDIL